MSVNQIAVHLLYHRTCTISWLYIPSEFKLFSSIFSRGILLAYRPLIVYSEPSLVSYQALVPETQVLLPRNHDCPLHQMIRTKEKTSDDITASSEWGINTQAITALVIAEKSSNAARPPFFSDSLLCLLSHPQSRAGFTAPSRLSAIRLAGTSDIPRHQAWSALKATMSYWAWSKGPLLPLYSGPGCGSRRLR